MANVECLIPANPDIGGIGTRVAVCAIASLAVFNAVVLIMTSDRFDHLDDSEKKDQMPGSSLALQVACFPFRHLKYRHFNRIRTRSSVIFNVVKNLERSIFMVGLSVIISAIIQMRTSNGFTPYHSLTNNLAGLLIWMARPNVVSLPLESDSGRREWYKTLLTLVNAVILDCWQIAHSVLLCGFGLYVWATQDPFFLVTAAAIAVLGTITTVVWSTFQYLPVQSPRAKHLSPPFVWVGKHYTALLRTLSSPTVSVCVAFAGCVSLIIYMIVSTEMTIRINDVDIAKGGSKWTYGQTLALFNAVVTIGLNAYDWYGACKKFGEGKNDVETGVSKPERENDSG
ncbi:hypothetical protein L218DRAFT_950159 [Marasmius fiardii PR-910]|nr:hypothetical protein L218DRAFT_950159 [Marasmius fiardii PR-910]